MKERVGRHLGLIVAGAMAGAAIAFRIPFVQRTLVYTYDSYYYLGTARSLLHDLRFAFRGVAHTRFLPLYPVTTALGGVFVGVERAGRFVPVVAWAGIVVVTYLLGRRLVSGWAGLAGAALLVAQPIGVKWSTVPMSEPVFTVSFMAALLLAVIAAQDDRPRLFVAAGALGGLSMLGRYEGAAALPLLLVLVGVSARRISARRLARPALLGGALFVAIPALWFGRGLLLSTPDQSYVSELSANLLTDSAVVGRRLRYFALEVWQNQVFAVATGLGLVVCLVRGTWRLGAVVLGGWVVLFIAGHLAWYYVYERFLVPALPAAALLAGALVAAAGEGLVALLGRAGVARGLAAVLAVLLGGVAVGANVWKDGRRAVSLTDRHILELEDDWGGTVTRAAAAELEIALGPGEAVATDSGAIVAYYADAQTYYLPFKEGQTVDRADLSATGNALLAQLRARRVRFLLLQVDPGVAPETALQPLGLESSGARLVKRYASSGLGPERRPVTVAVFTVPP